MMSKAQPPIEVVKALLAAMAKRDFDTAPPYVAEDCVYDNIPKGVVRGPTGLRAVLEPFFAPILHGPLVFHRTTRPPPHVQRLGWLPVTGVWEVHDGRITLWRECFDSTLVGLTDAAKAGI